MKKLIFLLIAIAILSGCTQEPTEKQVVFSTNYLTVNSGNLKSFDINQWEHYYWPYEVTVALTGETGTTYTTFASNSFQFFKHGTEPMHLPFGEYVCHVTGGGWKDGGNAFSYFVWSIKDTVITVNEETDVIRFELENTPALIVKDAEVPIELKGTWLDTVMWTGRGANDFVYVTAPWDYTAGYNGHFAHIEAGVSGRTTVISAAQAAAALTLGKMFQLALQAGDTGVQRIESVIVTNGTTAMTAGAFNVLIMRPIYTSMRCMTANDGDVHDMFKTGMPVVYPDSALVLQVSADGTASGIPEVTLEIASA